MKFLIRDDRNVTCIIARKTSFNNKCFSFLLGQAKTKCYRSIANILLALTHQMITPWKSLPVEQNINIDLYLIYKHCNFSFVISKDCHGYTFNFSEVLNPRFLTYYFLVKRIAMRPVLDHQQILYLFSSRGCYLSSEDCLKLGAHSNAVLQI